MTKTAFDRDNILTNEERVLSAKKCCNLLEPRSGEFNDWELNFFVDMHKQLDTYKNCTERQLAKLRDMVEKYAT